MTKFIITKKNGQLKHYKSNWENHDNIALHNGIDPYKEVIETGIIDGSNLFVIDCQNQEHKKKIEFSKLMFDPSILRARQIESVYAFGILKEGD